MGSVESYSTAVSSVQPPVRRRSVPVRNSFNTKGFFFLSSEKVISKNKEETVINNKHIDDSLFRHSVV
jgi:hypothetical protein